MVPDGRKAYGGPSDDDWCNTEADRDLRDEEAGDLYANRVRADKSYTLRCSHTIEMKTKDLSAFG